MSNALILTCDGCGRKQYDRNDMLEAWFPEVSIPATSAFPVALNPLTLGWVGPCCASMANDWQPGDPEVAS